jgi:hypothetical protein
MVTGRKHRVVGRPITSICKTPLQHRVDRTLVGGGAQLVTGRMTAKVLVAGTVVHVDNRYLVVWLRQQGAWKVVAYQPTPIITG